MNSSTPAANFDRAAFIAECNRRRAAGLLVTGNTYWVRGQLSELGGIWDGRAMGWLMPDRTAYDAGMALANGRGRGRGGKKAAAKKAPAVKAPAPVVEAAPVYEFEAAPESGRIEAGNEDMPF